MKTIRHFRAALCFVILYAVNFLLLPILLPKYYPSSNNAMAIMMITSVLANIAAVAFSDKYYDLMIGDALYGILICLYNGNAYGIGLRGIELDGNQLTQDFGLTLVAVAVILVLFVILQITCTQVKMASQRTKKKKKRK